MAHPASGSPLLIERLATLSDLVRLRILRMLESEELSVGELAKVIQLPQSTVSRHLKLLYEGAWIVRRTEGTASLYRLNVEALESEARELWELARRQLNTSPTLDADSTRLAQVIRARQADSKAFFGRLGGEWDELRQELFGSGFTAQALLSTLSQDWIIADLGCGTGNVAQHLAPFVRKVIAVDREPAMLNAARKRLEHQKNIDFRRGDLGALPIEAGEIDAAVIFLVLHHLPEPQIAIDEAARVLKSGGLLLIVDMVRHDRESYRFTMGHQHLGFEEADVKRWAKKAGMDRPRVVTLQPSTTGKGPPLFVATMYKK